MDNANDSALHQHGHEGGAYRQIYLISGVARRQRWTEAEKAALVAENLQPGIDTPAESVIRIAQYLSEGVTDD